MDCSDPGSNETKLGSFEPALVDIEHFEIRIRSKRFMFRVYFGSCLLFWIEFGAFQRNNIEINYETSSVSLVQVRPLCVHTLQAAMAIKRASF